MPITESVSDNVVINIPIKEIVLPMYQDILRDILEHGHTHYVFKGGRGSTKSSFISEAIPLILLNNPMVHAVVFRKVGNTMKTSVWGQITWGINKLGLERFFHIPKSIANPITFLPTGQKIYFLD